jgi:energy-coupling factor transporter ATP-binding protein EcfA2
MSHEEVQAEVVAGAVALGMPEAEAQADTERAIAWLSQVLEQQPRE